MPLSSTPSTRRRWRNRSGRNNGQRGSRPQGRADERNVRSEGDEPVPPPPLPRPGLGAACSYTLAFDPSAEE